MQIRMHVCMDEHLRTEALAESNSKKRIIEPSLLQVRMKNTSFPLRVWTKKLSPAKISGYCWCQSTVVWNAAVNPWVALLLEMVTDFWALVLRGVVGGQCDTIVARARTGGVPGTRQSGDMLRGSRRFLRGCWGTHLVQVAGWELWELQAGLWVMGNAGAPGKGLWIGTRFAQPGHRELWQQPGDRTLRDIRSCWHCRRSPGYGSHTLWGHKYPGCPQKAPARAASVLLCCG